MTPKPSNNYGTCPLCNAVHPYGTTRERRLDGNTRCGNCGGASKSKDWVSPLHKVDIKDHATVAKEATVAILKNWLGLAERGEIQEVLILGIAPDKAILTEYSPTLDMLTKLGAMEHMKLRWYSRTVLDQERSEDDS